MPFVKLDCGILNSTLWFEREAREVFITALLMAEPFETQDPIPQIAIGSLEFTGWSVPPGWYGFVPAASVGIIHRAKVEEAAGFEALKRLGDPEDGSRSKDFEGRRLVRVDGGFIVLNFMKYRDRDYTAAERSRRYRLRVASRRDDTASHRNITQAEVEVQEEATKQDRTVEAPEVRTVRSTVVSRAGNSDGHGSERKQGNGANEPNALPRDHSKHSICGGPTAKFCLTYNQVDSLASRYRGATPEETRTALETFYAHVLTQIPDGKVAGDMVWLLKHFDAWLIQIGRVAPEPVKVKPKRAMRTTAELIAERDAKRAQGIR